jgi:hypothetical protein
VHKRAVSDSLVHLLRPRVDGPDGDGPDGASPDAGPDGNGPQGDGATGNGPSDSGTDSPLLDPGVDNVQNLGPLSSVELKYLSDQVEAYRSEKVLFYTGGLNLQTVKNYAKNLGLKVYPYTLDAGEPDTYTGLDTTKGLLLDSAALGLDASGDVKILIPSAGLNSNYYLYFIEQEWPNFFSPANVEIDTITLINADTGATKVIARRPAAGEGLNFFAFPQDTPFDQIQ